MSILEAVQSKFSLLLWLKVCSVVLMGYSYQTIEYSEGFRDKIFDMEIVATLGHALCHQNFNIRSSVVKILIDALAQGVICFCLWGIYTELFTDGFQDKIFDNEMVAALGHALGHEDLNIRTSAVKILTAALAQGMLCCFDGMIILKYSQRGFGTRYSI